MIDRYVVEVGGAGWKTGPRFFAQTIREAREKVEGYGNTADYGIILNRRGRVVARHERDRSTGRWYRVMAV